VLRTMIIKLTLTSTLQWRQSVILRMSQLCSELTIVGGGLCFCGNFFSERVTQTRQGVTEEGLKIQKNVT